MKIEKVYSQIENKGKDVNTAPFWAKCYHEDEITSEMKESEKPWFCYHIKFDGLTPIQLTKTERVN